MGLQGWRGGINHVVLSGDRVIRWPLDEHSLGNFDKEPWSCRAARRAGVGAPEDVQVGLREGRPCCSHRFVPGRQLPETLDSWHAVGRLAAAIARVQPDEDAPTSLFTRFGRDLEAAWRAHCEYNLASLTAQDPLLSAGAYELGQQDAIRDRLAWLAQRPVVQGLVHGDLRPANVIGPSTGGVGEVTLGDDDVAAGDEAVVIDWECAEFGPAPVRDLVGVIDHELAGRSPAGATAAFVRGWDECADRPLSAAEQRAHELLFRLDLVRWANDRAPGRVDELSTRCRERLDVLLG